ncbi:MAG: Tex-like N-terminal domain-containing protein, partial [Rikenellaceae bacterium]
YRKEATGGLDEVQLEAILLRYQKLVEIEKRKQTIIASITEQGVMTDELKAKIDGCYDLNKLEDIYLPFKPKRRTRATIAKEKGLEPLAVLMMVKSERELESAAAKFGDVKEALDGASDIVAEWVSENEKVRDIVRTQFVRGGVLVAKVVKKKESEGAKFAGYFDYREPLKKVTPNRYLAVCRGENEGVLKVSVEVDGEVVMDRLMGYYENNNCCNSYKKAAIKDSYQRLISPSIENEIRALTKESSDEKAIKIFTANLRQLLLAAPLGGTSLLAIDPGFRTGCKVVCLDKAGDLLI